MNAKKSMMEKVLGSKTNPYQQKERSLFIAFVFGAGVLVPSIVAMILSNSMTLQSNLLRSGSETLAIFFSWLTVRKAAKGTTDTYNYGYGKLENLASLVIAAVMITSLAIIFFSAIARFQDPVTIGGLGTGIGIGVLFAGLAGSANAWCWLRTRRLSQKEISPIMESQWRLFRARTIANLCVIFSLVLSVSLRKYSWTVYIDPSGSIVLSGFLFFSAYGVISMSVYDLLDRTLEESLQLVILRELATYFDEYVAFHGIRSRRSGGNIYVEVFLEFDGEKRMAEVQEVIDNIKTRLEQAIPDSKIAIVPTTSGTA